MESKPFTLESPQRLSAKDVSAAAGTDWPDSPTLPHVESPTLIAPPQIPGFEILQELGRGGMGVVYKARNLANGAIVAVKVLLSGSHAGALERERFRREILAAALQHPNIVKLLGSGEHAGMPYLVLEYIDGGTLADRLTGTPWDPHTAAKLVIELASAVQYAHDRDFIHRDLKPANILFDADSPKVTDFGLSKSLGYSPLRRPVTETGAVLGTPSYISPEQATGEKEVGPASDVYSLGAILYELVTGRPPFDGKTTLDIVLKVLNDAPIPPTRHTPELPDDLEAIVLKCLHKNPAKRYGSAAALAEDLNRHIAGESVVARPAKVSRRFFAWLGRRPRLTTASVTAAVMVLFILGASAYAAVRIQEANARAAASRHEAERAKAELERVQRIAEQERQMAAELREKYEQLRTFLESFRPIKVVQSPPAPKKLEKICTIYQETEESETNAYTSQPQLQLAIPILLQCLKQAR